MIKYFLTLAIFFSYFSSGLPGQTGASVFIQTISKIAGMDTIKEDLSTYPRTEYLLKNGKSFVIVLTPESDYLVNSYIFGIGFPGFQDTILFDEIELIDTVAIADINQDGYEELYIFTRGFSPGAYDHVFGVTSDEDKSYKEINFAALKPADVTEGGIFDGYQGQDVYTMENNLIKRIFPVYKAGDFYNSPSRGFRTLYYTLEKTDSGFFFKLKN